MRKEGWEGLLQEHLGSARDIDFEWGRNDCALWSASWIKKATDIDLASPWLGRYSSEAQLEVLMKDMGIAQVSDIPDRAGLQPIAIAIAHRGDLVLHPQGCLGISNGIFSYFLMERGVTRLRTLDCIRAWKVS